jgi:predicted phosphodiesterase
LKVLIVGDVHVPFEHPNYIKFLRDQKERLKPDVVVFIGDIVDHYAHSRFTLDPDQQGQKPEWQQAMVHIAKFYELFPEAIWIVGNHDRRPYRKAMDAGLGRLVMKDLAEVYHCPPGWEIVDSTEIDDVFYFHGESVGGLSSWQDYPLKTNQSCVCGHMHSIGGVRYHQRADQTQVFILETGAGVNDEAYAFAYGKNASRKSMLGCGFVEDGVYAQFIPMNLKDRKYRRIR